MNTHTGAGDRTRTGTDFTPRDFKSLVSAYSTTPAKDMNYAPHKRKGRNGDPDENRTRVTAVKGRCLNRLTTGPLVAEIGLNRTRTYDTSGMNRML